MHLYPCFSSINQQYREVMSSLSFKAMPGDIVLIILGQNSNIAVPLSTRGTNGTSKLNTSEVTQGLAWTWVGLLCFALFWEPMPVELPDW